MKINLPDPKPDFDNILKVLRREKPGRITLFEFFMNDEIYEILCQGKRYDNSDGLGVWRQMMHAFYFAGYDYASIYASEFVFPTREVPGIATISQNIPGLIVDRQSYEQYKWPDPENFDDSRLDKLAQELPAGMKFIVWGPGGILEVLIDLIGFENLCYMQCEDPELLDEICLQIGTRVLAYYRKALEYPSVGALIINDDWGFNSQTMLSPAAMRRHVFPWHKKIVEAGHRLGKPSILHSCGNLEQVMTDIIEDMKYDGKHSFEDNIMPVETAYAGYGKSIAIMGGFDVDFICRSSPDQIKRRVQAMVAMVGDRGGFAVGTGNSVPYYMPPANYLAMLEAVYELI